MFIPFTPIIRTDKITRPLEWLQQGPYYGIIIK